MMEVKIIELTKTGEDHTCLICCKNRATIDMRINRLVLNDSVISFSVCDDCLAKIQKDIETCE